MVQRRQSIVQDVACTIEKKCSWKMIDKPCVHGRCSINMDVQAFDIGRFVSVSLIGRMYVDGQFDGGRTITKIKHAWQLSLILFVQAVFFSAAPFVASTQADQVHDTHVACSAQFSFVG